MLAESKLGPWSIDQDSVTHIHTRPNLKPALVRQQEVNDLVGRWNPPANRATGRD